MATSPFLKYSTGLSVEPPAQMALGITPSSLAFTNCSSVDTLAGLFTATLKESPSFTVREPPFAYMRISYLALETSAAKPYLMFPPA